jgi:hypothetical protein
MLVAMAWFAPAHVAAEDAAAFAGTWRGPWYRGMSSGVMVMEIAPTGTGSVYFTNLETFGMSPSPLIKIRVQGESFDFSAVGASGRDFTANLKRTADGRMLRGSARYEGLQVKFELKSPD